MALIPRLLKSIKNIFSPQKRRKRIKKFSKKKKNTRHGKAQRKGRKTKRKTTRPKKRIVSRAKSKKKKRPLAQKKVQQKKPLGPLVGQVTHFFTKIQVCVIKVAGPGFRVGDKLLFKGAATGFEQKVRSLQVESRDVPAARRGQLVGLKVDKKTRAGDRVYKI